MHGNIKILFIGDLVGLPGRAIYKKHIAQLKQLHGAHMVVVNGENSAYDGRGITPRIMEFYKAFHADVVTTGNHCWAKKEIVPYFAQYKDLLRPINFPSGCPGVGATTFAVHDTVVGVINVQGRVFMRDMLSCPIRAVEAALVHLKTIAQVIIVDMHAEASSEKMCMAAYFDGKVSAVVGTHTHVPTADERILAGGTAFITDVGMGGAVDSIIGVKTEIILRNMLLQMPVKFEVATEGVIQMCGVVIEVDTVTGRALSIERVRVADDQLDLSDPDLKDK